MDSKAILPLIMYGFIGWAFCAATMGISMAITSPTAALWIHATLAPLYFIGLTRLYYRTSGRPSPLTTSLFFVCFVIFIDFFLVALVILHSFDMFASLLGTWIPFALIFLSSYLTGVVAQRRKAAAIRQI